MIPVDSNIMEQILQRIEVKLDKSDLQIQLLQLSIQKVETKQIEYESKINDHETRLRLMEKWHFISLGVITAINFFAPFVRDIFISIHK